MKTRFFLLTLLLAVLFPFTPLVAEPNVRVDGYYRLWGEVELRAQADFSADALQFVTLNHEGGLPIKVLEVGKSAVRNGESGTWVRVMLTSWVWSADEQRVSRYSKFWVFVRDDAVVESVR